MGQEKNQEFLHHQDHHHHHHHHHHQKRWIAMKDSEVHEHDHDHEQYEQNPCSSIEEASTISNLSSSSSSLASSSSSSFDTTDDASSPSSPNSSRSSLYDLSDLMSHLPIKRGLSKFYHGKSDSFTSLARITSVEDIPKKEKKSYKKMMNPKSIICKKNSRKKKLFNGMEKKLNA